MEKTDGIGFGFSLRSGQIGGVFVADENFIHISARGMHPAERIETRHRIFSLKFPDPAFQKPEDARTGAPAHYQHLRCGVSPFITSTIEYYFLPLQSIGCEKIVVIFLFYLPKK